MDPFGPLRSILPALKMRQEYLDAEVPLRHLKSAEGIEPYVTPHFRVGDIVTRGNGDDLHRVISTNGDDQCAPDMISVVCIKEPPVARFCDGTFAEEPWVKLGELSDFMADRCDMVERP